MKGDAMEYRYRTSMVWKDGRRGTLASEGKPDWPVACGPEFGGHEGYWNPEDMFVASIEVCTMSTYLWLAERYRIPISSYRSEAEGLATMEEGSLRFTGVKVTARVTVPEGSLIGKAWRLFDEIRKYCLVLHSIKTEVTVQREVTVEEKG